MNIIYLPRFRILFCTLLPMLTALGSGFGYEQLSVSFYHAKDDSQQWILLGHDSEADSGHGFRIMPSQGRIERFSYQQPGDDGAAPLRLADSDFSMLSGWWPKSYSTNFAIEQTRDGKAGFLRHNDSGYSDGPGISIQVADEHFFYQKFALQQHRSFERQVDDAKIQHKLFWPKTIHADNQPLEDSLKRWWREASAQIVSRQIERQGPYPMPGDPQPWCFDWDLQWISVQQNYASAILFARIYSQSRGSGFAEETLTLQRLPDGQWIEVDPLQDFGSASEVRESIRKALNEQEADGDYFAKNFPDVLDPATRPFRSLRFGDKVLCLFSNGVVAPPAAGMIAVLIEKP